MALSVHLLGVDVGTTGARAVVTTAWCARPPSPAVGKPEISHEGEWSDLPTVPTQAEVIDSGTEHESP